MPRAMIHVSAFTQWCDEGQFLSHEKNWKICQLHQFSGRRSNMYNVPR